MIGEVVYEREPAHEVDFSSRSVENARVAAFVGLLRHIDQAFVHLADHLGIDRDLLVKRAVFGDREVVALQELEYLLEPSVRDQDSVSAVKLVLIEESPVKVRGECQRLLDR